MRVVVTGATGNVGTSLLERLAVEPAVDEIVGVARREPAGWQPSKVTWHTADVATDDLRAVVRNAEAVVHLAWQISPTHDQQALWRTNVLGSERLVRAVEDEGVPVLVHASSVGAYSPGPHDRRVDESWPTQGVPTLGYSWQKAYVERVLDALEARDPSRRVVRFRPALIFKRGAARHIRGLFLGPLVPERALPPAALLRLAERSPVPFQVVHTADVARAMVAALVQDVRGAFNLATEPVLGQQSRASRPVAAAGRTLAALTWHLHLQPTAPGWIDLAAAAPLMDSARARRELAWEPQHDAPSTLRALLDGLHDDAGAPTAPLAVGV